MYIYRTVITLKSGRKLHARECGKKAFRFWVDDNKKEPKKRY